MTMLRDRITAIFDMVAALGGEVPDPDLRTQKIALLFLSFAIVPMSIILLTIEFSTTRTFAVYVGVGFSLSTLISLTIYIRGGDYTSFRKRQLAILLFVPLLFHIAYGGFTGSANLIFSPLAPLLALLGSKPKEGTPWLLGSVSLVLVGTALEPLLFPESNLSLKTAFIDFGFNIMNSLLLLYLLVIHFVNQKNRAFAALSAEQAKSEGLLLNVLPRKIADILKVENRLIADSFPEASILFADLVGFTPLSSEMPPTEMVQLLNEVYTHFDNLVEKYGLEKIRSMGDDYMVAAGVPTPRPDHAQALANMALDICEYAATHTPLNRKAMRFRVGINSGPVVAGVVGRKKFHYDVWGDTVNTASRMESHGVPGKVQVTRSTYTLLKDKFVFESRGKIEVKGKGEMETWFLVARKDEPQRHLS